MDPAFDQVVAAFDYAGLGQTMIRDYKVHCRLALAGILSRCLARAVRDAGKDGGHAPDWLVPVPARRSALLQRGFSPPAEVARLLGRQLGLSCRLDLVRRRQDGPKQAALGRTARLHAQLGVYVCDAEDAVVGLEGRPGPLAGARIAVVDDVLTTGATLHAVASALKAAGAARVEGWVLARAVSGGAPGASASAGPSARSVPGTGSCATRTAR